VRFLRNSLDRLLLRALNRNGVIPARCFKPPRKFVYDKDWVSARQSHGLQNQQSDGPSPNDGNARGDTDMRKVNHMNGYPQRLSVGN